SSPRFGTTYYSSLGRTLHTLYRSIGLLAEGDDVGLACIPRSPARRLPSDEPRHDVARGCSDQRADVLLPDQRWTLPITATVGRSPGSVVGVAARWYLPVGDARIAQFTIGAPPELDGDAFVTNVLTLLRRPAAASSAASAASGP